MRSMLRTNLVFHGLASILLVAGCGGGDDGADNLPFGADSGDADGMNAMGLPPPADPMPTPAEPPASAGAAADGEVADESLDPMDLAPLDPVLPPGIALGNGRLVDGTCTPVCADASTDPDAQGVTDGWGYERDRSCLVPDSDLELEGELCDIPELAPMPELPPCTSSVSPGASLPRS